MAYLSGGVALSTGWYHPTNILPTSTVKPVPVFAMPLPKPISIPVLRLPSGPQTSSGTGTAYSPPVPQPQPSISFSSGGLNSPSVTIPRSSVEVGDISDISSKFPWPLILIAAGLLLISQRKRGK